MGRQSTLFDMFGVQPTASLRVDDGASPRKKARKSPSSSPGPGAKKTVQTTLDAGQPAVGPVTCPMCGMVYTLGVKEDDALHKRHCSGAEGDKQPGAGALAWAAGDEVASDVMTGLKVVLCDEGCSFRDKLRQATEALAGCEVAFPADGLVLFAAAGSSCKLRTLHAVLFAKQLLPRPASGLLYCITAVFATRAAKSNPPPGIGALLIEGITGASVFTVRKEQVGLAPSLAAHPFFSDLSPPVCGDEPAELPAARV
ncbi:hypothetical protein DIPPA_34493 [Diplonema papillatum]|nr:hypothetical protein DIPPA_34493 [Diplonema papillatum]